MISPSPCAGHTAHFFKALDPHSSGSERFLGRGRRHRPIIFPIVREEKKEFSKRAIFLSFRTRIRPAYQFCCLINVLLSRFKKMLPPPIFSTVPIKERFFWSCKRQDLIEKKKEKSSFTYVLPDWVLVEQKKKLRNCRGISESDCSQSAAASPFISGLKREKKKKTAPGGTLLTPKPPGRERLGRGADRLPVA